MEIKKKNLLINIASVILTIGIFVGMAIFCAIRISENLDGINLFAPGTQTKNEGIIKDAKENLLNHLNIQEQRGYILKDEILKNILPSI